MAGRLRRFFFVHIWERLTDSRAGQVAFEFAAIIFLGSLYIGLFLPLEGNKSLNGVELERLAGVTLTAEVGLKDYGQIPTWNPYVGTGEPFLNNPFNYLFNPFSSLPILLFGGTAGSKIALGLGLLIAGYGMWALARVMGMGAVARVMTAALYMMSGGIAGKFHPGHFQLGLSLAWVPLVLAGFWWTLHSRDRRAPVLLAAAFALLFFAGNIYYTLHTIICCGVMLAFHLVAHRPHLKIRTDRVQRAAIGAVFALGLTAVQFVPNWSIRDSIKHGADPGLESRYGIEQVVNNFTMTWDNWQLFMPEERLVSVDYAYIGAIPFVIIGLGAAALIFSRQTRQRFPFRAAAVALTCAGIMVIWGAGQSRLLQRLYANIPLLAQFRYVGRAHSIAALWLIVLAGLALDSLWSTASHVLKTKPVFSAFDRAQLARAAALGMLVWLVNLLADVRATSASGSVSASLDAYRFGMTFRDDLVPVLPFFVAGALALDTLRLMIVFPLWRHEKVQIHGIDLYAIGTRLLRVGIAAIAAAAIIDVMLVNSLVFKVGPREADLDMIYNYIHANDSAPIPAVLEPNTENYAFEAYYHRTRQWGLNEGWIPVALPNLSYHGDFTGEARWTIVRDQQEPATQGKTYVFQQCLNDWTKQNPLEPCAAYGTMTAALYELPEALPYAFIVPEDILIDAPTNWSGANVGIPTLVNHEQDTITVIARTPSTNQRYFLVIQETHFPGWVGSIDGIPTQTTSLGTFTAIPLLTGVHTYTISYQPPGFTTGAAISLVTVAGIWFYFSRLPRKDQRRLRKKAGMSMSSSS